MDINGKMKFVTFLAVIFVCAQDVHSKWVEGTINTNSDWKFLTRFCFLTQKGALNYEFRYPVGYGTQEILLYYDTPGQWDSIYKTGMDCNEKMSVLSVSSNQIIALNTSNTQTSAFSGCKLINYAGDTWYHCKGQRSFRSSRERWWYIAVGRCGPPKDSVKGLYLEYKIHMTNGDDLVHKEFSADEFYILPVDIVFFIIYLIMSVLSVICAVVLKNRQLLHTTYKLYLTALFIWTFHLLIMVIAWGYYGTSGWEVGPLEVTGRIFQATSSIIFILMLILMAKGYTITRGRLTKTSVIKITVFLSIYIVVIAVLFIWEGLLFDPGKVLYYYESPPGYGLIAMHLIGWLWFLYATVFTLKHCTTKSMFYIPFFAFYTLWFWAGPIVILIAMFVMAKWSREKTVNGVEQFVAFWGHIFFLVLTRPSAANGNFPYHVRTTQIAALASDEDEINGEGNPYTINTSVAFTGSGPNLEFFITAKTEMTNFDSGGDRMFGPIGGNDIRPTYSPPPSYPQTVQGASALPHTFHGAGEGPSSNNNNISSIANISTIRDSQGFSQSISILTRGMVNNDSTDIFPHPGHPIQQGQTILPPIGTTGSTPLKTPCETTPEPSAPLQLAINRSNIFSN